MVLLIIHAYIQKVVVTGRVAHRNDEKPSINSEHMISKKIMVKGMTCNHCKQNVEEKIKSVDGIEQVRVDLSTGKVTVSGKHIDLDKIQSGIESIGYDYLGETA